MAGTNRGGSRWVADLICECGNPGLPLTYREIYGVYLNLDRINRRRAVQIAVGVAAVFNESAGKELFKAAMEDGEESTPSDASIEPQEEKG